MFSDLHFLPADTEFPDAQARIDDCYPPQAQQIFEDLTAEMARRGRDNQAAFDQLAQARDAIGEAEFTLARTMERKQEAGKLWQDVDEKQLQRQKTTIQKLKAQLQKLRPEPRQATEVERKNVSILRELNGDADDFLHGIMRFSSRREMK